MSKKALTIGRNPNNDWILNDKSVEDFHAEIRALGDSLQLVDLQSKLGVIVNGKKIQEHQLLPGDVVQIGFQQLDWESKTEKLIRLEKQENQTEKDSQNVKTELSDDLNRFLREMATSAPLEEVDNQTEIQVEKVVENPTPLAEIAVEIQAPVAEPIAEKQAINSVFEKPSAFIKNQTTIPERTAEIRVVKGTSMETSEMPISNNFYYFKIIALAIFISLIAILGGYYLSAVLNR